METPQEMDGEAMVLGSGVTAGRRAAVCGVVETAESRHFSAQAGKRASSKLDESRRGTLVRHKTCHRAASHAARTRAPLRPGDAACLVVGANEAVTVAALRATLCRNCGEAGPSRKNLYAHVWDRWARERREDWVEVVEAALARACIRAELQFVARTGLHGLAVVEYPA
eukprot:2070151-Pleurochrysis_carterae.AAC.5